ncbi:MAG TPA: serine hydrolase domain-containing protein, partial [Opitutaceae bacterium]|nr:serine hydrolase domain-containing protein [Opitutaceae bacterium]
MKIKILFAALVAPALFATGQAQTLDQARLDQFFDRLAEKNKAMGSLTIAKDGEVIYSRAIGYSQIDATAKAPLTTANRFRIASITKMFTAVMILQLVDEGKLKLADPLDRFVPQVPNAGKITLEQILAHRSGIPNVRREQNSQGNVNTTPITKDEILALIVEAPPAFEPDSKFLYSNSGYFLLGLIVEKVTGKSYAEALEERINSKIGLKDTYTATGNIDVNRRESLTYIHTGSEWKQVPETHPSILFGAGQIVSTPNDLARFIRALFDGKLISPESLRRMKTLRDGWGLGMEPHTYADKAFYGHAGGGDNYGSWLTYQPEEKLAVAYMSNAKVYPVPEIVRGVIEIYYGRPFEIPSFETLAISADVLDQYVGVYGSPEVPVKFTVTRQGSTLFVQPGNQTAAALEATAPDKFQLLGGRIVFEFDAAKKQMIHK